MSFAAHNRPVLVSVKVPSPWFSKRSDAIVRITKKPLRPIMIIKRPPGNLKSNLNCFEMVFLIPYEIENLRGSYIFSNSKNEQQAVLYQSDRDRSTSVIKK